MSEETDGLVLNVEEITRQGIGGGQGCFDNEEDEEDGD